MTKQKSTLQIKNIVLIILGTAILAFGTAIFIVPFDLVTGGLSGIGIVLDNLITANLTIPMLGIASNIDFYILILTWTLFFIGMIFLGKDFALKTLISTICYPVFFALFHSFVNPDFANGIFVLANASHEDITVLLAAIFGGALVGAGCAITFIAGGSTGGIDILAFIICKLFPKAKNSHVIFALDVVVITIGVFAVKDMTLSLLGIVSAFICAIVVDKVFLGNYTAYVAQIVTSQSEELTQDIIQIMDRTATIVDATGAYSKTKKKIVMVSFNIREYAELIRLVKKHDPKAFITISRAHEIHGEGWTKAKS